MGQRSNYAAAKGAQTKPSREEFALDMEQSTNNAAMKDAPTKPYDEECAFGMGHTLDESAAFSLSHESARDDTATLLNQPIATDSINQERGRDPPSVLACQAIDHVEV